MQVTLFVTFLFSLLSGMIFAYVGARLGHHTLSTSSARRAWKMFLVWWYTMGLDAFLSSGLYLFAAFGVTSLPLVLGITFLNFFLFCLALCGLVYYLLYLFTGSTRTLACLGVFYTACFALLVYYVISRQPIGVNVENWNVGLTYRLGITRPVVALLISLMLYFPQIICSIAYFSLYFRLTDPTQRYRVLLVSWSIILWFLSTFSATLTGFSTTDGWRLFGRSIAVVAALTILVAYFPLGYFQRRFGVKAILDEA